jgi:predicted DNA binding protein
MYDFSFTITYDPGADEYMDVFIEHESLRSETLYACLDPSRMWALELITGAPDELAVVDDVVCDDSVDRYSITERSCNATCRTSRLTETTRQRVFFTHVSAVKQHDAIPLIGAKYVSDGALFTQTRSGKETKWNVLLQNDKNVGLLYDTITGRLADGLQFSFEHMTEGAQWESRLFPSGGMRAEQREALTAAVTSGYFETPRQVTLDELARERGLPRSTLSYRLRRATAELAKSFVAYEQ